MNRQRLLVAAFFVPMLVACTKPIDRSTDSATTINLLDTIKPPGSPASFAAVCRAAAARDKPKVRWAPDTALTADLNYDGQPELVVWGTESDSIFVISMVECSGGKSGRVWSMALRALAVFGTTDVEVALEKPALSEGYLNETCMGAETTSDCRHLFKINKELEAAYSRGGRGLVVGVEDRDHVHIYWDPDTKGFVTWRP